MKKYFVCHSCGNTFPEGAMHHCPGKTIDTTKAGWWMTKEERKNIETMSKEYIETLEQQLSICKGAMSNVYSSMDDLEGITYIKVIEECQSILNKAFKKLDNIPNKA